MSFLDQIKERIKQALARFATRKTEEQVDGMTQEAKGIVASTKDLARTNPLGLAVLVGLAALLLWGVISKRDSVSNQS